MSETSNKLSDLIETSLHKIKEFTESETVVGEPIITPAGVTVIPVSKLSMGFASGGLDYSGKRQSKEGVKEYSEGSPHFGGGGGTGVTLTPVAFLIVSADGKVDLLSVTPVPESNSIDKLASLIERSPEIAEKIKKVFGGKKKHKKDHASEPEENEEKNKNDSDDQIPITD